MSYFDRYDICEAYAAYAQLWAPIRNIDERLHRIGFRLSPCFSLEGMSENAKEIYGGLVRRNERLLVGFKRLYRRRPELAGSWPGTYNIPGGDVRRYLQTKGILNAVEALVP
jgi:hypothetical protein